MAVRIIFVVVTLFWVTMNVLLWRAEFGARNRAGATVPLERVWNKILTAPDTSSMEILHNGRKIGFCRFAATIEQSARDGMSGIASPPEGMILEVRGFNIDFEGNIALPDYSSRVRFDTNLKLDTNRVWRKFDIRLGMRPMSLEIESIAAEETLRVLLEDDSSRAERTIRFSDLQNPEAIVREMGGPLLSGILATTGLSMPRESVSGLVAGIPWEARIDWMNIGHSQVRVYRLEAKLLEKHEIVVLVSRVGEILRVELPDNVVFVNDQLTSF